MIVSHNEFYTVCSRACRGCGAPAGSENDAAKSVVWLQARGLQGVENFADALFSIEASPPQPLAVKESLEMGLTLQARGQSMLFLAAPAIGFALTKADELAGGESEVWVTDCLQPMFLVPHAVVSAGSEWRIQISWQSTSTGEVVMFDVTEGLWVYGKYHAMTSHPVDVQLTCRKQAFSTSRDAMRDTVGRAALRPEELAARAQQALHQGLEIPEVEWTRFRAFADCILVPGTETSRKFGAGALIDDNE